MDKKIEELKNILITYEIFDEEKFIKSISRFNTSDENYINKAFSYYIELNYISPGRLSYGVFEKMNNYRMNEFKINMDRDNYIYYLIIGAIPKVNSIIDFSKIIKQDETKENYLFYCDFLDLGGRKDVETQNIKDYICYLYGNNIINDENTTTMIMDYKNIHINIKFDYVLFDEKVIKDMNITNDELIHNFPLLLNDNGKIILNIGGFQYVRRDINSFMLSYNDIEQIIIADDLSSEDKETIKQKLYEIMVYNKYKDYVLSTSDNTLPLLSFDGEISINQYIYNNRIFYNKLLNTYKIDYVSNINDIISDTNYVTYIFVILTLLDPSKIEQNIMMEEKINEEMDKLKFYLIKTNELYNKIKDFQKNKELILREINKKYDERKIELDYILKTESMIKSYELEREKEIKEFLDTKRNLQREFELLRGGRKIKIKSNKPKQKRKTKQKRKSKKNKMYI